MLVAALLAAVWFLRDFLAIGALAALTVLIFNPLYFGTLRLLRGHRRSATWTTIVLALCIVIIPLIAVAVLSYYQALTFMADLQHAHLTDPETIRRLVSSGVNSINATTSRLPDGSRLHISVDGAISAALSLIPSTGSTLLGFLRQTSGSIVSFFLGVFLYVILLAYLFIHQTGLMAWLKRISPLANTINEQYLRHVAAVGRSMVFGTFVVAAVQGILGATFLAIAGVPYPVFWAVFLTVLSIIPVGSGAAIIPAGIIEILIGNLWQGLFILSAYFLITTNIDNVLRALLVSKDAHMPPVLTLFAIFAGIKLFGAMGVIYGPIIMVIIMTTFQIYDQYSKTGIPLKS